MCHWASTTIDTPSTPHAFPGRLRRRAPAGAGGGDRGGGARSPRVVSDERGFVVPRVRVRGCRRGARPGVRGGVRYGTVRRHAWPARGRSRSGRRRRRRACRGRGRSSRTEAPGCPPWSPAGLPLRFTQPRADSAGRGLRGARGALLRVLQHSDVRRRVGRARGMFTSLASDTQQLVHSGRQA